MKIFLQILTLLFIINSLNAQTHYYVNNSIGKDTPSNGTGTGTSAWKSIEYALNNVSNPASDQIILNISGDIYDLMNDQIDINRNFTNLTLLGEGIESTFIQSAADSSLSNSRVMKIYSGNNITLKNMTIRFGQVIVPDVNGGGILNDAGNLMIDNCKVTKNFGRSLGAGYGGGIANLNGNLTILNSTISHNSSIDSCYGGGVGSQNGTLIINNSTISFNSAAAGGGIAVVSNGSDAVLNLQNSTIYGNTAKFRFGGIRISVFGEQSNNEVHCNINSTTIFNNSAIDWYGGIGIVVSQGFSIKNSIIAGNTPDNISGSSSSGQIPITSGGYNIIQSVGNITIEGEQNNGIGIDPGLLPLADNNSLNGTQTCAIPVNSPAKDQIPANSPNGAPLYDQRGYNRIGNYDIGAYEISDLVAVKEKNIPINFVLEQNYPNPFNPMTKIVYNLPDREFVQLEIFDILGNSITTLLNEEKPAGTYEINWFAAGLSSGVYFYKLKAGSFLQTKKMILMK